jgi:uncharacterized membrane protein
MDQLTMATITVLKFNSEGSAENVLSVVLNLTTPHEAAIVTWPTGKKKPKTKQLPSIAELGTLQGSFWGILFGLIFFIPLYGLAESATMSGSLADIGIDDDFINSAREKITEGTSALFLLTSGAVLDKVCEAMKGMDFELIASNLSKEQEAKLRETFAEE